MGKPTGFMEYERQVSVAEEPKERIKHFNEFHTHSSERKAAAAGCKMYGMRCTVLSGRDGSVRYDERMPAAQPRSGMERSGIYRKLAAGI